MARSFSLSFEAASRCSSPSSLPSALETRTLEPDCVASGRDRKYWERKRRPPATRTRAARLTTRGRTKPRYFGSRGAEIAPARLPRFVAAAMDAVISRRSDSEMPESSEAGSPTCCADEDAATRIARMEAALSRRPLYDFIPGIAFYLSIEYRRPRRFAPLRSTRFAAASGASPSNRSREQAATLRPRCTRLQTHHIRRIGTPA